MKTKTPILIAVIGVIATVILICAALGSNKNTGSNNGITNFSSTEDAEESMQKALKRIKVRNADPVKSTVDYSDNLVANLPNIETKYPLTVIGNGDVAIEIFSTSEKAGKGQNGWLNEVAEAFNASKLRLENGKVASVSVRSIPSGASSDYISNNIYVPQAYTPSNVLFGNLAIESGAKLQVCVPELVSNTAGIAINKDTKSAIDTKYGETNINTIIDAVIDGEMQLGYTYPYTSATGLNFLVNALQYFDGSNMLSNASIEKFQQLQKGIPFVCYTTDQMVNAMQSGTLQAGCVEYQAYVNNVTLKSSYEFIPFGYKHSNPLYSVGDLSADENEALSLFTEYAMNSENQAHAKEYGFNQDISFSYNEKDVSGSELINAQQLWKQEKDSGTPTIALFIADVSGSMNGDPIARLKSSLLEASKKINSNNYIGLISYSDDVTVNLPIAQFDLEQRSYFAGAVESLTPGGNTATYDALLVGIDTINKMKESVPDAKTMIFVLSDGQCNKGIEYGTSAGIVSYYGIPIYTIGYNENIDSLKDLSSINEAVYINADTDDVVYELSALFNAQM